MIVAAVIGGAARNEIGKLLGADQVAPPHLQAIEPAMPGDLLERALDGVVGRRLAECTHRLLHGLVRRHRDGAILHALDAVRPDDRADGLAELERGAPGVGADIVERAHLHRADHAGVVEGDLEVEVALGTMGVAGAHVLQPVLDQPHRETEPAGEIADQHRVLDAALDAVAAPHVHVVVDPHRRARQLERERDLVGKARHLHRGEDVEHLAPGVPAREHAEGLDRHGRAAPPRHPHRQAVRAVGKILLDLAPDEGAIEQHVGAVIRVHDRAAGRIGGFAVEHERQRLVVHAHQFGGVLGERAGVRDHRRDPFAGIARDVDGERTPRHLRGVEARQQRLRRGGKLAAVEHVVHARHGQRLGLVDRDDARGGMRAGHQRHVARARHGDVGGEAALAHDEAAILAHAAVGRYEPERGRAHGLLAGRFRPRMRSAASAIASTICA